MPKPSSIHKEWDMVERGYNVLYSRGEEPIYYHGPYKSWIIAGEPQKTIDFILNSTFILLRGMEASYNLLS